MSARELFLAMVLVTGSASQELDPATDFEPGLAKGVRSLEAARTDPLWVEKDLREYELSEQAPWTFSLYYGDGSRIVVPLTRIWFAPSSEPTATLFRRHKGTGRLIPFVVALDSRDRPVAMLPHEQAIVHLAVPRFDTRLTPLITQALNETQIVLAAEGILTAFQWHAANPALLGPLVGPAAVVRRGVTTEAVREGLAPAIRLVPGGGLAAHEAAGGHLIARHVGLSEAQLAERLASQGFKRVGSFTSRAVAEEAARESIDANQAIIASWMKSPSGKLELDYVAASPIGKVLVEGATKAIETCRFRLVTLKANTALGWRILTGFPQP